MYIYPSSALWKKVYGEFCFLLLSQGFFLRSNTLPPPQPKKGPCVVCASPFFLIYNIFISSSNHPSVPSGLSYRPIPSSRLLKLFWDFLASIISSHSAGPPRIAQKFRGSEKRQKRLEVLLVSASANTEAKTKEKMADSQSHPSSPHAPQGQLSPKPDQTDPNTTSKTPEHEKKTPAQRALDEAWERMVESWRKQEAALKREREEERREKRRMERRRREVQDLVDGFTGGFVVARGRER